MPQPSRSVLEFEQHLDHEILHSEYKRTCIMLTVLGVWLVLFILLTSSIPHLFSPSLQPSWDQWRFWHVLVGFLIFSMIYEAWAGWLIRAAIAKSQSVSARFQYLHAFGEVSLPTLVIWAWAEMNGPLTAVLGPPLLVYFLFIMLSALRLDYRLTFLMGMVAALEYTALVFYWLPHFNHVASDPILTNPGQYIARGCLIFLSGLTMSLVTYEIRQRVTRSFQLMTEHNRLQTMFGQHLSPQVLQRLLEVPHEMHAEKLPVAVMFLDIRNFTSFCERQSPEEVVNFLNLLFEPMIESITRHQGTINKFLGDGFMAVFGVPFSTGNDCQNAVEAAFEILAGVKAGATAGLHPLVRLGIGIHGGEVLTGHVGSSQRKEYTVIGDVVNVAARIEQLNKSFESQLLISEVVRQALSPSGFNPLDRGELPVKGRQQPIQIYQLA